MLKVKPTKRQHFVPKLYLKNFSNEKKGRRKKNIIWCFDKSTGKPNIKNIDNVALEKYFYDVIRGSNLLENELQKFENKYKKVLKTVITKKDLTSLSKEDKMIISHLIMSQFARTREIRELIIRMDKFKNEYNINDEYKDIPPEIQHISFTKYVITEFTTDAKLSHLLNMKWALMINNTELDYLTSDNPVNIYNGIRDRYFAEKGEKYVTNFGILDEGVEIYYPLTPKLCLTLVDSTYYSNLPNENAIEIDNNRHIIDINRLQVISSGKELYSKNNDFSIAENMLKEYPQFKGNIWDLINSNLHLKKQK